MQRRRECQSIPIDLKAAFHSSTWEPTVLATSHWPIPGARCAQASAPSSVDLDAATSQALSAGGGDARKALNGLIAAYDFLRVLNGHSRGGLPQVRQLKDALRGKTCSASCSSKLAHRWQRRTKERPLCADCVEKLENRGAPKISQM